MIPTDLAASAVLALGALVVAASLVGLGARLLWRARAAQARVVDVGQNGVSAQLTDRTVTVGSKLELLVGDVIRIRPKGDGFKPLLTPRVRLAVPFLAYGLALAYASTWLRGLDRPTVLWVLILIGCVLPALLIMYAGYLAGRIGFVARSRRVQARIIAFTSHPYGSGPKNQSYQARMEYDLDGRTRRAWSPTMYYTSSRTGRIVKLYVDRHNPANILTLGLAPLIVGIIVLTALLGPLLIGSVFWLFTLMAVR